MKRSPLLRNISDESRNSVVVSTRWGKQVISPGRQLAISGGKIEQVDSVAIRRMASVKLEESTVVSTCEYSIADFLMQHEVIRAISASKYKTIMKPAYKTYSCLQILDSKREPFSKKNQDE